MLRVVRLSLLILLIVFISKNVDAKRARGRKNILSSARILQASSESPSSAAPTSLAPTTTTTEATPTPPMTTASATVAQQATSNGNKTRVIVISDLHLGSKAMKSGGMFNNLCRFLSEIISNDDLNIQRLIMLGDIIEMWNFKFDEAPMTAIEIMASTTFHKTNIKYFFSLMREVAKKGVDVVYLRGNHDYEMTLSDLKVAMGGEKFQYVDRIVEGGIRYEHGHEVDIFNIDPPKLGNEKTTMRPLGYYVARSAETSELKRNREAGRSIQLCREMDPTFFAPALVTVLSVNEVFQVVIETLLREALTANPQTWYKKVIKGGDIYRNGKDVTLGDAIKNYYNLIERFRKERSMEYISGMISAGCGENTYWAQQTKEKVLIYGHTHDRLLEKHDRDSSAGGGKVIYANAGTWVRKNENTFVDIIFVNDIPQTIMLREYSHDLNYGIDNSTVLRSMEIL